MIAFEPGIKTIELFVSEHIRFLKQNPVMVRFFVRELLMFETEISPELKEAVEALKLLRNDMLKAISLARAKGEMRDVEPLNTIVNILSLDVFFALGKPLVKLVSPNIDMNLFEEKRVDHVLDLLMNGLRKQPEIRQ